MIRLLIFSFFLLSNLAYSQGSETITLPTDDDGNVRFQQVVKLDSSESAKVILGKARTWVGKAFNSASTVIQQYDPEQGILIVKGLSKFTSPQATFYSGKTVRTTAPYKLLYTLTVDAKPGRYRSTVNGLVVEVDVPGGTQTATALASTPPTIEESNNAFKSVRLSEKAKQENALLNVENKTNLLINARTQVDNLLQHLEKSMRQASTKEKDW
jgi:hypothetical protein